jgi:hypothetical protein
MGLQSDIAHENDVKFFCQKLAEKLKQHPEAAQPLKELGREIIETLPNRPEWVYQYIKLFYI